MSTQPQPGGRRPVDRVLAPDFTHETADIALADLRERRHLAEQEEVDLSYARRLLQGRLDLMHAEQARRAGAPGDGHQRTDDELARDLSHVLADETPRADHGRGRHLTTDPSRVGEHRRAAEQAVADVSASDPSGLDDAALAAAVAALAAIEHDVSETRHRVQSVMDVLTAEVARRYRDGSARVEDVLLTE
jgi:hypothetical protein